MPTIRDIPKATLDTLSASRQRPAAQDTAFGGSFYDPTSLDKVARAIVQNTGVGADSTSGGGPLSPKLYQQMVQMFGTDDTKSLAWSIIDLWGVNSKTAVDDEDVEAIWDWVKSEKARIGESGE